MTKAPIRIKKTTNPHGPGWQVLVQFGCRKPFRMGKGVRAWDFPWHSSSIHSPGWRTRRWLSYIPGYTLTITHKAKVYDDHHIPHQKNLWVQFTPNGHARLVVPQWWS